MFNWLNQPFSEPVSEPSFEELLAGIDAQIAASEEQIAQEIALLNEMKQRRDRLKAQISAWQFDLN